MSDTYTYAYGDDTYVNLTNRCNGSCVFCIRQFADGVGGHDLRLTREPTAQQVIAELERTHPAKIVFCGYGEPTIALRELLETARWAKDSFIRTRLDTNGLGSRYHGRDIVPDLACVIDEVSISLNAPNKKRYQEITRCRYGEEGFDEMQRFARRCRQEGIDVTMTVVDTFLSDEEIHACETLAHDMGAHFRVRRYVGPKPAQEGTRDLDAQAEESSSER